MVPDHKSGNSLHMNDNSLCLRCLEFLGVESSATHEDFIMKCKKKTKVALCDMCHKSMLKMNLILKEGF